MDVDLSPPTVATNIRPAFQRFEFEARIFFSLGIVLASGLLVVVATPDASALAVVIGMWAGAEESAARTAAFAIGAAALIPLTLLRIWAGSMLTPDRVMAFGVQTDALHTAGPYRLSRNPIYLADFLTISLLALYLPPLGLVMPALFLIHYDRIMRFEEVALQLTHGERYSRYVRAVPRLFPSLQSLRTLPDTLKEWAATGDGVRHNALYLLFIPGLAVAAWTDSLGYALIIGLPGVLDWAIIHTRIGMPTATLAVRRATRDRTRVADTSQSRERRSKVFDSVLYAQCWEDPEIDRRAFAMRTGSTVLSITSGGDNVLAFLLDDPDRMIALDLNQHQNDMLELKIAAMKTLAYDDLLAFCGVRPSRNRAAMYRHMRIWMTRRASEYWDQHIAQIRRGIIHAGRYERYMRLIRRCLRALIGRKTIERLFAARDEIERARALGVLDGMRWRLVTRALLSRRTMSLLFDPGFFRYLEEDFSFGAHFSEVARRALTTLPVSRSSFLSYLLTGNYRDECLPVWLRRENWGLIRSRLSRVQIVTGSCDRLLASLPDDSVDAFNFSNIFEWMPQEAFESLLREAVRTGRPGAVITYRNLLVPRSRPNSLSDCVLPDIELATELHAGDLSFIYRRYNVERISKGERA